LLTPGSAKRYVEAQLPVHAQYIPAGTVYFAELTTPLDFGAELMTPQMAASIGGPLPPGSVVHARLVTPLTSATAQKGETVEAVISQPLLDGIAWASGLSHLRPLILSGLGLPDPALIHLARPAVHEIKAVLPGEPGRYLNRTSWPAFLQHPVKLPRGPSGRLCAQGGLSRGSACPGGVVAWGGQVH
jgi:hypothetical protein